MAEIYKILGKVNPWKYAENSSELIKKHKSPSEIPAEEVEPKTLSEHNLTYDSSSETMEPIYFFILDLMNDFGIKSEKIVDNFTSSPGSSHFSEMGQKASVMQQQATKILGDVNNVLRSVLNLVYDLRDFRTRLQHYEGLNSSNENTRNAARLSLKQIWLDRVDMNRGNAGIKAMSLGQGGFQTLLDAFLIVDDESLKGKDGKEIDLNDRIKRILKPRIMEFNQWVVNSERELKKRYEIEKSYLKSQVNSLKIYSRWAKPYLKAAYDLEMKPGEERNPELVNTFDTNILELVLFGTQKVKPQNEVSKEALKTKGTRDFFSCFVVDFKFRGIPQKTQQGQYVFGGRAEVKFSSFVLNESEVNMVKKEIDKSDVADVLNLVEGITTESLEKLQEDIDEFLEEPTEEEKKKIRLGDSFKEFKSSWTDSFKDLFGSKKTNKKDEENMKPDNFAEKTYIRPFAEESARGTIYTLFDIYKKAHGMPSYTPGA